MRHERRKAEQPKYITDRQLGERYGVHRATICKLIRYGTFPKPAKLARGCARWRLADVEHWEREKPKAWGSDKQ